MSKNSFFTTGPFGEAQQKMEDFALGIYYFHCFGTTLERLLKLEEAYKAALTTCDPRELALKQQEISFYENIIFLTTEMLDAPQSLTGSRYD